MHALCHLFVEYYPTGEFLYSSDNRIIIYEFYK